MSEETKLSLSKRVIFPTSLWVVEIPESTREELNEQLIQKVLSTKSDPSAVIDVKKKKWYTPRNLHQTPEFSPLNDIILKGAAACLDHMKIKHNGLEITGCWGNVSQPGAIHHRHSHPNNFLSGVYYLQADEGANTITFHDPNPCKGLIRPPMHELSHETSETVKLAINPGDLLFFPNWLVHSVEQNTSDRERISIAFNVMFSNYMTEMVKPMW